jgi:hypothetical protein
MLDSSPECAPSVLSVFAENIELFLSFLSQPSDAPDASPKPTVRTSCGVSNSLGQLRLGVLKFMQVLVSVEPGVISFLAEEVRREIDNLNLFFIFSYIF